MAGNQQEADRTWELAGLMDPDPWRQQVRLNLRSKDDAALQSLAESPDIIRQPAISLICLAVALRERAQLGAASRVLAVAQHQHPSDFWVHFDMAQLMEKQSPPNFEQAASCYRAALAVRPRSPAAWNNLGNAQKKLNKLDEAAACYERAIELNPNYFMDYANLGLARYMQGRRDDAITSWRKAIELNPKGALNHSNLGHILLDQGKLDEAIRCFQTAVALQPKFSVAHFNLGAALAKQQKLDEAIASYRVAIEIDPKFVLAHQRLAAILFSQKQDYAAAIEIIQKVISLRPDLYAPHQNLAVALKMVGREQEAIVSHRKALQLQPNYVEACISLSRLLATCSELQLRNSAEALDWARKAVELAPQSADSWSALGFAQYRSGDWKASIEALEKSIALTANPNGNKTAQWFFLAMANFQLGEAKAAREWYGQAVEWTERNQSADQECFRLRAEADELMKKE